MKVKQLIETLKQFDKDLDIRFYFLENFNLEGCKVETILEADNQVEITVEKDQFMRSLLQGVFPGVNDPV